MISVQVCILSHHLASLARCPLLPDHKLHKGDAIIYPLGMQHTGRWPSNHLLSLITKMVRHKAGN